jgi:hypothetical protein
MFRVLNPTLKAKKGVPLEKREIATQRTTTFTSTISITTATAAATAFEKQPQKQRARSRRAHRFKGFGGTLLF